MIHAPKITQLCRTSRYQRVASKLAETFPITTYLPCAHPEPRTPHDSSESNNVAQAHLHTTMPPFPPPRTRAAQFFTSLSHHAPFRPPPSLALSTSIPHTLLRIHSSQSSSLHSPPTRCVSPPLPSTRVSPSISISISTSLSTSTGLAHPLSPTKRPIQRLLRSGLARRSQRATTGSGYRKEKAVGVRWW